MENPTARRATFGGGCFWCLEAVFVELRGVQQVVSGYAGGNMPDPSYEAVCSGRTGHAEVIEVTFDPEQITYRELLDVFFTVHDPTTRNRQGADVGTQYRSAIFYHDEGQKAEAAAAIADWNRAATYPQPIVTELVPLERFYPAETYHQQYFANHPQQPYCQAVVAPKVAKLRKYFQQKLRRD